MSNLFALPKVDAADRTPKYVQAERILAEAIRSGMLKAGRKLPPTREVGPLMNVSLVTAHKALERLVRAGLVRRVVGRGTFVCDDVDAVLARSTRASYVLLLDQQINLNDFYHGAIIDALRDAGHVGDTNVQLMFQSLESFLQQPKTDVAGALCFHPLIEQIPLLDRLADRMPCVVLGGKVEGDRVACVDSDNFDGARRVVRHLTELGHRRILILAGPTNLTNTRDRVDGALAELNHAGLPADPNRDVLVSSDSTHIDDDTARVVTQRMCSPQRPTAIVACGFYLALGVIRVVRQNRLVVPYDVSVTGFDDPASAPLLDPPLTTIRQPLRQMADVAFQLLGESIRDPSQPAATRILATELITRASTTTPSRTA